MVKMQNKCIPSILVYNLCYIHCNIGCRLFAIEIQIFKESVRSDWAKLVKTLNTYTVTACILYSNRKTGYDDVFVLIDLV